MEQKKTTISDTKSKKIAIRLKKLREEKGISHETLSRELKGKSEELKGISKDSLIKYERADKYISGFGANKGMSIDNAVALANFYNVSVDYLLCNTDIRTPNTELKHICDYTGLSENAVNTLHKCNEIKAKTISRIIECAEFIHIVDIIIKAQNNRELLLSNSAPIIESVRAKLRDEKITENMKIVYKYAVQVCESGLAPYYKNEISDDITAIFDKLIENGEK